MHRHNTVPLVLLKPLPQEDLNSRVKVICDSTITNADTVCDQLDFINDQMGTMNTIEQIDINKVFQKCQDLLVCTDDLGTTSRLLIALSVFSNRVGKHTFMPSAFIDDHIKDIYCNGYAHYYLSDGNNLDAVTDLLIKAVGKLGHENIESENYRQIIEGVINHLVSIKDLDESISNSLLTSVIGRPK